MDKIKMDDLGRFGFATDVKFDMPVEMSYGGVKYVFTAVVEYAGATMKQAVELANRMAKTDFMNAHRPNTNDKQDVLDRKVATLEALVQQRRVPIRIAEKASATMVITPDMMIANLAAAGDVAGLEALMTKIMAAKEQAAAAGANAATGANAGATEGKPDVTE